MLILFWIWVVGGLTSLISYAAVSFCYDRCFVTSTWIKLWLSVMVLLGPIGSLLTVRTLGNIVKDMRNEIRRLKALGEPMPETRDAGQQIWKPSFTQTVIVSMGSRD